MCFPAVEKIWKSVKIWQSYREFKGGNFFETQCRNVHKQIIRLNIYIHCILMNWPLLCCSHYQWISILCKICFLMFCVNLSGCDIPEHRGHWWESDWSGHRWHDTEGTQETVCSVLSVKYELHCGTVWWCHFVTDIVDMVYRVSQICRHSSIKTS